MTQLNPSQDRRDFLKTMATAGSLFALNFGNILSLACSKTGSMRRPQFDYRYRSFSVEHLEELKTDIETLKANDQLSHHPTYRSYIDNKDFTLPEDFPDAKSVIIFSFFYPMALVNFYYQGEIHELIIPPEYYDNGVTREMVEDVVKGEILKKGGYRLEPARTLLLKRSAVRSGLAKYGRNNISYVDGFGTFHMLMGFFTDWVGEKDHWGPVRMHDSCETCRLCMNNCPNQCIREDNFVIDAGRCIPLYNEVQGEFPNWMNPKSHNALMGCMRCQEVCPHNQGVLQKPLRLEDVSEEETEKILAGETSEKLIESLTSKLKGYYPATSDENFPIFTRNLAPLLS